MMPTRRPLRLFALLGAAGCVDPAEQGYVVVVSGRVVDELGTALPGAQITLGSPDGQVVAITRAGQDGSWTCPIYGTELDGNELRALYDMPDHAQGRARYVLNLRSPTVAELDPGPWQTFEATDRRFPTMQLADAAEVGSADGRVVDWDGAPVPDARIELRQGWNAAASDPVAADVRTGADGRFAVQQAPGWWTASVLADDTHGAARFGVFVSGADTRVVNAAGVVPPSSSDARPWLITTLTWSPHPLDLDLHLTSTMRAGLSGGDGTGLYHIWSGNPRQPETTAVDAEAELRTADADGDGPETITIVSPTEEGDETHIAVFDNDDLSDPSSTQLGLGRAQVQLWMGDDEPQYFTVSPGTAGTLWRPVEIEEGRIYAVEDYPSGASPDDATAI